MKLEPDLVKAILIWGEKRLPDKNKSWLASELKIKGYNQEQIIFHTKLLFDNGYIECIDNSTLSGHNYFINNLTMNGYQYLELLKSQAWNTAKGIMHEFGVIFAESAIRAVIDKAMHMGKT